MSEQEKVEWEIRTKGKLHVYTAWMGLVILQVVETKDKRLPYDVWVDTMRVGVKRNLQEAMDCAERHATAKIREKENAK